MAEIKYETKQCPMCGLTSEVFLKEEDVKRWQDGEHVQIVWPHMTRSEREVLMTGIHAPCWEKMWAEPE